ncbi:MAG: extracellular solute-binding protein [Anaerolineae bacterium]|nr:extracellular solute-binding protein [Anaerolineae bacterium]
MMDKTRILKAFIPFLTVVIFALSACDLLPGSETAVPPTITPTTETPEADSVPDTLNTPVFQLPDRTPQPNPKLIIWLPPEIASRTEAGAVVLSDQLLAFNNATPNIEISIEQKSVSGQGGILNYLRTGKNVVPAILPDLIAIPVQQITAVSEEGLIFPMEDVIDITTLEALYPVAQEWHSYNSHIVAYPFAITEMPLIEYSSTITEPLSMQWQAIITGTDKTMVLPAVGTSGAKLALQFYLQAGGSLENEAGQPALELEPLTLALKQLYDGRQNGFILPQSSNLSTIDEGRLLVQNGTADYALSASDEYLKGRTQELIPGFSAIPGLDGSPIPLVRGWAWAITTSDPVKKAAAAQLINSLTSPENLGNWSFNSRILPANPDAFGEWPTEDTFISFADQELQRANSLPINVSSPTMKALEDAVFDVITLSKTPADAAAEAVTTLQP